MAKVAFKKGLVANLPATYSAGTFYVTTDERAIYLDVSDEARIRLGDFQEFATVTELEANANPSKTALYYVSGINCLAKWDGTKYVQINRDTGMTSIEVVGEGNAVTAAVYSEDGRKLTLTKGATYMTAADVDGKITAKVGELKLGDETFDTVKAYVDKKTDGIATDAALETLTNRVTTAESEIDALQTQVGEGTVSKQIDDKIAALKLSETYDAKGAADAVDKKLVTEAETARAAEKANATAAAKAQSDVDALKASVGTVPADKTVVKMIEEAQTAATYDDTALKNRVAANETAIATLNGDATKEGSVAKQVADAVAKIVADAPEAYDTLQEIAAWITGHAGDAAAMNKQINTNKSDIASLTALVGTLPEGVEAKTIVAYIQEVVAGLKIGDYAKAADLTAAIARIDTLEGKAHEHANKAELDKVAEGDVAKWNAAEQNAKGYADGLNTTMAGRVKAIEDDYLKAADKTELSNALATETQTARDAEKANAAAIAAETTRAQGAEAQALTDAKAYTDTSLTWGEF